MHSHIYISLFLYAYCSVYILKAVSSHYLLTQYLMVYSSFSSFCVCNSSVSGKQALTRTHLFTYLLCHLLCIVELPFLLIHFTFYLSTVSTLTSFSPYNVIMITSGILILIFVLTVSRF